MASFVRIIAVTIAVGKMQELGFLINRIRKEREGKSNAEILFNKRQKNLMKENGRTWNLSFLLDKILSKPRKKERTKSGAEGDDKKESFLLILKGFPCQDCDKLHDLVLVNCLHCVLCTFL
jgi:hypothetical protein